MKNRSPLADRPAARDDMMDDVRLELGPSYNKIYMGWLFRGADAVAALPLDGAITRPLIKAIVGHWLAQPQEAAGLDDADSRPPLIFASIKECQALLAKAAASPYQGASLNSSMGDGSCRLRLSQL